MRISKYYATAFFCLIFSYTFINHVYAGEQVLIIRPKFEPNNNYPEQINDLKANLEDMKFQMLSAQDEINNVQEINQNLSKKLFQIEANNQSLINENILLKQNLINKDKQITDLQNQKIYIANSYNTSQILDLTNKNTCLTNDLQKLKELYEISISKQKTLENQLLSMKNQADLLFQISELKNQISQKNMELSNIKQELNREKSGYLSLKSNNDNVLKEKSARISLMQNQIYLNEKEIQDSQNIINHLTTELAGIKASLQSEIDKNLQKDALIAQFKNELDILKQKPAVSETKQQIAYIRDNKTAYDYYNIGKAYQSAKDYNEAINNFNKAIYVDKSYDKAYKELGLVYAETGDFKHASCCLKKYLEYSTNPKEQTVIKNFIANIEN